MSWESGKRQVLKFIGLMVFIFFIVTFMLLSFLVIQYKDIETWILANIAVDGVVIISVLFIINYRVWKATTGIHYAMEIYNPDGTVDNELWKRQAFFEVDIDKVEEELDENQRKILLTHESGIKKIKEAVEAMSELKEKQKEKLESAEKKAAEKARKAAEKKEKKSKKRAKESDDLEDLEEALTGGEVTPEEVEKIEEAEETEVKKDEQNEETKDSS